MRETTFTLLLALWNVVYSFNIDLDNSKVYEFKLQTNESLFGYSVALRNTQGKELMVGAPLETQNAQRSGSVYSCGLNTKQCQMLKDYKDSTPSNQDQRKHNMMGVTLAASGDTIMAGAPRWWIKRSPAIYYRGRVAVLKSDDTVDYETVPCEDEGYSNYAFGYCEAGMSSSSMTYNNLPLFVVGAPGSVNFKGALFTVYRRGSIRVSRTKEDRLEANSYMGYAVTTGKFTDPSQSGYVTDIAGGAPRGSVMAGKVIIYNVKNSYRITEEMVIQSPDDQVGTYFGAAVYAVDLDNDGKDDLVVGAPQFAKIMDEGRVYVYLNRKGPRFTGFDQTSVLEGDNQQGARFGSSIANIGDINKDGFQDIAIGAPYGGVDGKGMVYIYNGGQNGLRVNQPQRIAASDVSNTPPQGFGISLAGGVDIDNNKYPDLAVGAFRDAKAYVLRTKPVIKLTTKLSTSADAVPSRKSDKFSCGGLQQLDSYNCLDLEVQLSYTGEGVADSITVEATIDFDKNGLPKRAKTPTGLKSLVVQNITLTKDIAKTETIKVAVLISVDTDVVSPIEFTAKYKVHIDQSKCTNTPCAILDAFGESNADTHEITYLRECKSESTCLPQLEMTTSLDLPRNKDLDPKQVRYGVVYQVDMLADIVNLGEAAYQSVMKLNFSSDLQVIGVEVNKASINQRKIVSLNAALMQLQFPLANPISPNETVSVLAKFSVSKSRPTQREYTFTAEATAFGDMVGKKNKGEEKIDVNIETCVGVSASARPQNFQYLLNLAKPPPPSSNTTLRNESVKVDVIGNAVTYSFIVQNRGNLPVENLKAKMNTAVQIEGLDLIYVVYVEVDGAPCKTDFNNLNYVTKYQQTDGDGNPTNPGGNTNNNRRRRRNTDDDPEQQDDDDGNAAKEKEIITCFRQGSCKKYTCDIERIEPNKGAIIKMYARFWDYNLGKPEVQDFKGVKSEVEVEFVGSDKDYYIQRNDEKCQFLTDTTVFMSPELENKKAPPVPWWVLLLSVAGALLLLAIAIAILYKVGFFKRNRKIKEITGPTETGHDATNPSTDDDYDDDE
ncbi:integrin alpha-V-like [Clytia hemisphaerica]|uniref:Uncharacterized protein n=1 Tax=Clytia hemisphaerica TaxID=252671 RepID=A0A7M5XFC5_9CNID